MNQFKKMLSSVDMTEGPPWKKLLYFTIPLLVGNMFQQLYNTADAVVLGRYIGDGALAAVGASIPLLFLVLVLLMGVAVGTGIMISQYFGAKLREDLSYTIGNSLTVTTLMGIFLMITGPFIARPLLIALQTPPEILDDAVLYTQIMLWGVLPTAYFNVLSGILRGLGDALSPLIYLAIASVLNIVLNVTFIAVLGWGMPAVAVGTVVSQGVSAILCLRKLLKMTDVFDTNLYFLKLKRKFAVQILKLGIPTGVSQAIIALAVMAVQPLVNGFGDLFIASYVVVMRIDGFVVMPAFSFSNAITVFTGQNMGAGKIERLAQGTRQCGILAFLVCSSLVGGILLFGHHIASVFTQTPEVIELSQQMLFILAPGYIAFSVAMVLWGTIRGAGDAISPLVGASVNSILVRVPAAYLLIYLMGEVPEAIMYSILIAWISNTLISIIVYKMGHWRKKGLVKT
ncbi:MAG: MATE family efflux transporter [Turicibacter sp.]|nr:MATE family efflux transporter [Turicibacter sp.]